MAIKGKGKARSRQVARAPRREPVPVPVPFFLRRWVQVVGAFLAGAAAVLLLVWVTNGLRENSRTEEAARLAELQKQALQEWRTELEGRLGTVGQVQNPQPPLVAGDLATVLGEMVREEEPSVTTETLRKLAGDLDDASRKLDRFDLADLIRDKGFTSGRTESILISRSETVRSLQAYRQATLLALEALEADGEQRVALAKAGKGVADIGTGLLEDAWRQYEIALKEVGISIGLPGQDLGL